MKKLLSFILGMMGRAFFSTLFENKLIYFSLKSHATMPAIPPAPALRDQ